MHSLVSLATFTALLTKHRPAGDGCRLHVVPPEVERAGHAVKEEAQPFLQRTRAEIIAGIKDSLHPWLGHCCARVDAHLRTKTGGGQTHDAYVNETAEEIFEHSSLGRRFIELDAKTPFSTTPLVFGHCEGIREWGQNVEKFVNYCELANMKLTTAKMKLTTTERK